MWTKLTNWFIGIRTKLIIAAVILGVGFMGGWMAHKTIIDAGKLHSTEKKLDKAKKAPGEIIKFNQQLRATNVDKDPCASQPIPADALKLLR